MIRFAACLAAALALSPGEARAQIAPSSTEIAAYTGLFAAAQSGNVAEIARLAASGADLNGRDAQKRTPLHVAAYARQRAAMRELARLGADPKAQEGQAYDAITIAAVADDPETLAVALTIGGDAKAVTSPFRGTALIASAHLGHVEVVKMLIAAGAPLDHVNNLGWTALIEAVILGDGGPRHTEVVRSLLAAGARRDIADRDGVTPLQHAERRGYAAIVALLK